MPIYEYQCLDCGHRFEVLQRMGEGADGLTCPDCEKDRVSKQFSTFASNPGAGTAAGVSFGSGGCGGGSGFS